MNSRSKDLSFRMAVAMATVAAFLATVSLASAHNGPLVTASPNSAPAGSRVAVNVNQVEGPVEVRWATATGEVLATGTGPTFTVTVTIPATAAPNVYYLRAVVDGEVKASGAFEVTASAPPPPADVTPPPATESPQAGGGVPAARAPGAPTRRNETPRRTRERNAVKRKGAPAERSPARGSTRRVAVTGASVPAGAVEQHAGQVVFAASVAAKGGSRGRGDREARASRTTHRSKASSKRSRGLPSLTSSADSTALDDGPDARLGIGVALLALGLVAPLAGFLVAEARRRRAPAGPTRQH